MKKYKPFIYVALVLVLLYFGRLYFFPNEKEIILARLSELSTMASIDKKEHPFERLGKARQIGNFFHEEVTLTLSSEKWDKRSFKGRKALIDKIVLLRSKGTNLKFSFVDSTCEVKGQKASVHLTAKVEGVHPETEEEFIDALELIITLTKEKGTWLISQVENVETIGY